MSQKIRIKLKSYDHNLVDKSADKIVKTVKKYKINARSNFLIGFRFMPSTHVLVLVNLISI